MLLGGTSISNTGGSSAAAGQEVHISTVEITTAFSTTSTTLVDVTGSDISVTGLDASKTYDLVLFALGGDLYQATSGKNTELKVLIEGTDVGETFIQGTASVNYYPCSAIGFLGSQTGATSYSGKLQTATASGGTAKVGYVRDVRLVLLAIEQAA